MKGVKNYRRVGGAGGVGGGKIGIYESWEEEEQGVGASRYWVGGGELECWFRE